MATPSTSKDSQKTQAAEASTSDRNMALPETSCYLCQRNYFFKRILRVVIRECSFYVTVQLIRLNILDGVPTVHSKNTINFLRLSDEHRGFYPTHEDMEPLRSPGRSFERMSDFCVVHRLDGDSRWGYSSRRSSMQHDEKNEGSDGIIESFISRLAENLCVDVDVIEDSIDHVMTSRSEVLLEMDYRKLIRASAHNEAEIECMIINMFWQPKASNEPANLFANSQKNVHFRLNARMRSRSVPEDRSKGNSWFKAVDCGRVVPFHSRTNASIFTRPNTVRDLLTRCIHEIEENMINAFSWYLDEYFYHDFVFPRTTLSYAQYSNYRKIKKISNPKVIVVKDNPLEFGTHFAYVLALNFYSNHKYVQRYMRDVGLLCESIIRVDKDIPFVIRSLNPITRMHIFHMVYKKDNYSRPSYENVFKTLIMLRDAMFRLRLKEVSMCKIGCCCERLDFGKVLKMTEYVFLDTDISVRIGLNLMKCWHFRSGSLKHRGKTSDPADLYLERIDRFVPCDGAAEDSETRSNEDE